MSSPQLATLRAANAEIRKLLCSAPADAAVAEQRFPTLDQMQVLSRHLTLVDALLRGEKPQRQDADLRGALAEYAASLESLRAALETAQKDLAKHREQLIAERGHQTAAAAWATAYKQSR
ncbi:MAG: hypothetical protein HY234_08030 [Acidobacteria bacterium]|nr:hypothetical protein [Acidobacteriota bacterium]MBI3662979.1 hypothetical protein [Acidobacteriota bacterium]